MKLAASEIPKPIMNQNSIRLRVTVESMREQLLHHFADYEKVIEGLIKEAVAPEKIMEEIQGEIQKTLSWKIGNALNDMVSQAVRDSSQMQKLIETSVERYLDELAKKKSTTK